MSTKTSASSVGGSKPFNRLIFPIVDRFGSSDESSVANRAYANYIEVRHSVVVQSLGIAVGICINGNLQLGLYDSAFNLVCSTAPFAVAGLARWSYHLTTTNPTITPGIYYITATCDSNYVVATSGVQYKRASSIFTDIVNSANLGNSMWVRMDAAYPLPAIFVPVHNNNGSELMLILKVTIP